MQTAIINENSDTLIIAKKQRIANDLDYLTALLHARYGKMAVEDRLIELSRLQSLTELYQTIYPDEEIADIGDFQRLCVFNLASEIYNFRKYLSGPGVSLLNWILTHFQLENLKVLLRTFLTGRFLERLDRYIIYLPGELSLDVKNLANASTIDDFIYMMPKGIFQDCMNKALRLYGDYKKPFFFEATLDNAYFSELLRHVNSLSDKDKESIKSLICQEIDIFHLMLIVRGRFIYNLSSDLFKPFHIDGTRLPKRFFNAMIGDPDILSLANRIEHRIIDRLPIEFGKTEEGRGADISLLEQQAWRRFYRLSNQAFRGSHMGLGAVMGYIGIRRIEIANLITISEGIRNNALPETTRRRLITKTDSEVVYV
ncbi:MAG TPA: V-type ATPase subunit [Syntrophorhabdaceae bacterium]|nr:V-type ATPase subunit [Syntrophorhabdaceae bacterium]